MQQNFVYNGTYVLEWCIKGAMGCTLASANSWVSMLYSNSTQLTDSLLLRVLNASYHTVLREFAICTCSNVPRTWSRVLSVPPYSSLIIWHYWELHIMLRLCPLLFVFIPCTCTCAYAWVKLTMTSSIKLNIIIMILCRFDHVLYTNYKHRIQLN